MSLLGIMALLGSLILVSRSENCSSSAGCCPPSWQSWGNSCYRLTPEGAPWDSSRSTCWDMGGKMLAPRSIQENDLLVSMRPRKPDYRGVEHLWVACNDIEHEGSWKCEERGEMNGAEYFNMYNGEPNGGRSENCLAMRYSKQGNILADGGMWHDVACSDPLKHYQAVCVLRPEEPRTYCSSIGSDQHLISSCLVDHIIGEFVTKSMMECVLACSNEPRCLSFNIKQIEEAPKMLCQLNNATSSEDPAKFKTTGSFCIYSDLATRYDLQ